MQQPITRSGMVIRKYLSIQGLVLLFLLVFVKSASASLPAGYQKPDAPIYVYDVRAEGRLITRLVLQEAVINYTLSTNEDQDEVYLHLPFAIENPEAFIPETTPGTFITGVSVKENGDGASVIAIHLSEKSLEFFDFASSDPARLTIDFFREHGQGSGEAKVEKEGGDVEVSGKAEDPQKVTRKLPEETKNEKAKSHETVQEKAKIVEGENFRKERKIRARDRRIHSVQIKENPAVRVEKRKVKTRRERMLTEDEKLYLEFAPLKNDIRLPLERPIQETINGEAEDQKLYNLALTFYEKKKYSMALKSIDLFLKSFSDSPVIEEIAFLRANLYYTMGEQLKSKNYFDKAISYYKEALRRFPSSKHVPGTLFFIGVAYFNRGLYYEALGSFEVGSDKYPDNKYTLLMRLGAAEVYFKLKDYKTAAVRLGLLKSEYRDMRVARDAAFRLGDLHFEQRNYKEAIAKYINGMELWPDDIDLYPNALFNMAESYFWVGKYEASLRTFKDFLKMFARYIRRDENIYAFGSNALVRIAEIMEIMGAPDEQVRKILLETEFRFRGSYGAKVAAIRRMSQDIPAVSKKMLKHYFKEIDRIMAESKDSLELVEFASIVKGESLLERKEYEEAVKVWENHIVKFPRTLFLGRLKSHIVFTLKRMIAGSMEKRDFHTALRIYSNNRARYFNDENSYDVMFRLTEAYLNLGLHKDAELYLTRSLRAYEKVSSLKEKGSVGGGDVMEITKKLETFSGPEKVEKPDLLKNEMSFVDEIASSKTRYVKKEKKYFEIKKCEVKYVKARIEKEKGNLHEAARICEWAISECPKDNKKYLRALGGIYIDLRKWKDALRVYVLSESRDLKTLLNVGKAFEKTGQFEKAGEVYGEILKNKLVDSVEKKKLQFSIARLYYRAKIYSKAFQGFETYVALYPDDKKNPVALYRMGDCLNRQRKPEEAIKMWESVIGNPDAGIMAHLADESVKTIQWRKKFKRQLK